MEKMIRINALLVLSLFFLQGVSIAQDKLSLCNGVWTTKACDKPEKSFDAVTRKAQEINEDENSAVKVKDPASILHPLNMKVIDLRYKYNKDFDISQALALCQAKNADLNKCQEKVAEGLEKIRAYELELDQLALKEKQLEVKKELNEKPAIEQNVVTVNQVTTSVEKNTVVSIKNERHDNKKEVVLPIDHQQNRHKIVINKTVEENIPQRQP